MYLDSCKKPTLVIYIKQTFYLLIKSGVNTSVRAWHHIFPIRRLEEFPIAIFEKKLRVKKWFRLMVVDGSVTRTVVFFLRTCALHDKGTHDRKHNTPNIWTEVPHLLGGVQRFDCSKCPGTRGAGRMDYVKAPRVTNSAFGAPFHSFLVARIKRHVEASGIPVKSYKVSAGILACRSTLASRDIPFAHPPTQCALYGTPYSSSNQVKCYRNTCHLFTSNIKSHTRSIFSDFDWFLCVPIIK